MLAGEQAALRRVATVVARGASREAVFEAIAHEVARLVRARGHRDAALRGRPPRDGPGDRTAATRFPVGSRQRLGGENLATRVLETGEPVRLDDFGRASGSIGRKARETGLRSAVGTPIVVDGRIWGVLVTGTRGDGRCRRTPGPA